MAEGIVKRHSKGCPAQAGRRCRCNAGYEAFVYSPRDGKKVRKTFARLHVGFVNVNAAKAKCSLVAASHI